MAWAGTRWVSCYRRTASATSARYTLLYSPRTPHCWGIPRLRALVLTLISMAHWWLDTDNGKLRQSQKKTCPSATLSTTNLTGPDWRSNPDLSAMRGRRLAASAMARPSRLVRTSQWTQTASITKYIVNIIARIVRNTNTLCELKAEFLNVKPAVHKVPAGLLKS